jgi:hypothetical protein
MEVEGWLKPCEEVKQCEDGMEAIGKDGLKQ